MKQAGLFFVFLIGFALVNGFGQVGYEDFDELRRTVIIMQDITEDIRQNMDTQGEKINEILDWITDKEAEPPPQNDIPTAPQIDIPQNATQPGIYIIDDGRLNQDAVVSYIQFYSRLPRPEIESIINIYFLEAKKERVNHDIAIAQMCYATQFLNNRALLITRNYAGLSGATFYDKTIGIRAHIQHLKGFATRDEILSEEIVDPRFYMAGFIRVRGTITRFDELFFSTWSPENALNYGNGVRSILDGLYQYSNIGTN
jgi:hypothetical protein